MLAHTHHCLGKKTTRSTKDVRHLQPIMLARRVVQSEQMMAPGAGRCVPSLQPSRWAGDRWGGPPPLAAGRTVERIQTATGARVIVVKAR